MAKRKQPLHPDAPLYHRSHAKPFTRRDFLRQGFVAGAATLIGNPLMGLFSNAHAAVGLSTDITDMAAAIQGCTLGGAASGLPVICFDLAGGANIAGSNVLVGRQGQLDVLSTAGYSKLGIPGDMLPGQAEVNPVNGNGDHTDTSLGLAFHSKSAMLKGILNKTASALGRIDGIVIPARSENDTGNNPHNPMYAIAEAVKIASNIDPEKRIYPGEVVTLIGSRNSDSGANSMAPAMTINPEIRPTKVDRPSDVTGMVDTGDLTNVFSDPADVVAVMESMVRNSDIKLARVNTTLGNNQEVLDAVRCGYAKSAHLADQFAGVEVDPALDNNIVGASGVFSAAEFTGDREFRKTASVMKMVLNGHAAVGTIAMGGYDYHTGDRSTGEIRDERVGKCIGACLEYAAKLNTKLMIYVYSDGSVFSNGMLDNSQEGGGKGVWTGDNQSTASSFILVFNPGAPPQVISLGRQIGFFNAGGSVVNSSSVAANNVNLLVETVVLNYMALNGNIGQFGALPFNSLGSNPAASLIGFNALT
jgi:hypothetical protein